MLSSIHTQDVPLTEGFGEGTIPPPRINQVSYKMLLHTLTSLLFLHPQIPLRVPKAYQKNNPPPQALVVVCNFIY